MSEYDDYLYPNFVPNINFVAKNIKLTHELVNSIESEVQEVKLLIQQKFQRQADFQQLLTLINQERDLLHNEIDQKYNQINHREINLNEEIETLKQEYEEKILFYQSELDRSMIECNSAMNEKTKAMEQSKELETYCLQLENEYNTQRQDLMQKDQEITQLQQENQQYKDYIHQIEEELRVAKSMNQSYPPNNHQNNNNNNYNTNPNNQNSNSYNHVNNNYNNNNNNVNHNPNYYNPNDTYPNHNNSYQQISSQPLIEPTQPISKFDSSQLIIPMIPKKNNITLTEVLKQHSTNPNNSQSNNPQTNVNPNMPPQIQTTQTIPSSIATTTTTSTLNQSPIQSPNHKTNQPQNNIDYLDSNQTTKIESLQKRLSFLELERETMYHPIQQMASQFEYIVPQNTESVDLSDTLSPTSNQIFPYENSFEDYRYPPQSPLQPQSTNEQDFTSRAMSQLDLQSPSDSLDGDQLLLNNYTSNAFEYDDSIQLEDLLRVQV